MNELSVRRRLGTTSLEIAPLGMGVAPLGNLYATVSDEEADATLAAASEENMCWFDVAPLYGLGLAEERLGRFLRTATSGERVVSTKVGRLLEPCVHSSDRGRAAGLNGSRDPFVDSPPFQAIFDYSAAGIERSLDASLKRLSLDRVQILLLHDVDRATHGAAHRRLVKQLLEESLPTLNRLKSEGRVDAIGMGVNHWDIGFEILASADIDCILLAGRYTLLDQSAFTSGFLDACARRQVSVLAGGVFNSGFLAGGSHYDYRPATPALLRRRTKLAEICARHDVNLIAAALQFARSHEAVISLTVGARSPQEIQQIVRAYKANIPGELWAELRHHRLIPKDCLYDTLSGLVARETAPLGPT